MIKKTVLVLVLVGLVAALVGCDSMRRAGRNIADVGKAVVESAEADP